MQQEYKIVIADTSCFILLDKIDHLILLHQLNNKRNLPMVNQLLLQVDAGKIKFADVLAHIDHHYTYTPAAFKNGNQYNALTENQGSARVLFYAHLNKLNREETLRLFAEHYQNVLDNPHGTNHQNIRQFMHNGWDGVEFEGTVLLPK